MFRLIALMFAFHAPLFAVSVSGGSPLALTDLRVTIDLSTVETGPRATVTCKAVIHNPGAQAYGARISLPRDVVPENQREGYAIEVGGVTREPDDPDKFAWKVHFEADQQLIVTWSCTLIPTDLPHAHPLGLRSVRVELAHMRGYTELPEAVSVTVTAVGFPPALFGRTVGETGSKTIAVRSHPEDYVFQWYAETYESRTGSLAATLKAFTDAQRTHVNRSYTETLVHLADLYEFKGDKTSLAETCAVLAALETDAARVITHCGPWATWRKHVPWQLRRFAALGNDKAAANEAKLAMTAVWDEYLKAAAEAQPFEHFDRSRFGNYWDYDWARTRELYANALELLGDTEAAQAVRDTE
ncbi:MAG: hypothetical protein K8I27_12300 [Planctomycetes bacterium]|nr:hypothetical protein [Planctomycetota bacterium]